jgi:hypothetical protein
MIKEKIVTPTFDNEGYPSEETLKTIRKWAWGNTTQ